MHFTLTLYIVVIVFVKIQEASRPCKVPNGDAGTCVEVSTCKPLWDLYKKKHKTKEDHQYIGQAYCGNPASSKIKMCCPSMSTWDTFVVNPVIYEHPDDIEPVTVFIAPIQQTPTPAPLPVPVPFAVNPLGGVIDKSNTDGTSSVPDVAAQTNCGVSFSSANKITGGEPTSIDQYPWLVLLEYAGGSLGCGGSLITAIFVMTAAHCLDGVNGPPTIARLAEYNTTSYPTDYVEVEGGGMDQIDNLFIPVETTFKHPDYTRSTIQHDIGLVKLAQVVEFSDFIKLVCLPTRDYVPEFSQGTNFTVAGWGDDLNTLEFFDVKKEVIVPYVTPDKCKPPRPLIDSQMCAGGEEGKDTCKGDSGGPLMYETSQKYIAVGVVSVGPRECGTKGRPAIYTQVFKYLNWINSVIQGQV